MIINWFPGHMTKSLGEIESNIKIVDAVIYVLDSRAPFSCINPAFDKIVGSKPIIYALNKADIVPENELKPWVDKLTEGNRCAVVLNSTASNATTVIVKTLKRLCADKIQKMRNRGINPLLRAMVIGVPNSGKSTLINNLCGKAKTVTGNRAGVTRGKQWVKVGDCFEVMDTPGTLYPKLDNYDVALNLACIGSVRDEVVDMVELSKELICKLTKLEVGLRERYGIVPSGDANEDLEAIARRRGFVLRGGELDVDRTAIAIIDDFRKGKMGKIILEKAYENY